MYFYTSFSSYVCVLTKTSDDVSLQRGASRADKDSMMYTGGYAKQLPSQLAPMHCNFTFCMLSPCLYSISRLLLYSNTGFELT